MNTQTRLGIWISKPEHLDNIDLVLSHYKDIDDMFIISDESIYNSKYAIISSYYINFSDIMIAFLDLEDFVINKNHIRSSNISVFCKSSEIIQSKLDKSFFNNVRVVEL
jgi:hypothetical protein